jgi:hypothetical protein
VKHGLCDSPADRPYSTLHRYINAEKYQPNRAVSVTSLDGNGFGESITAWAPTTFPHTVTEYVTISVADLAPKTVVVEFPQQNAVLSINPSPADLTLSTNSDDSDSTIYEGSVSKFNSDFQKQGLSPGDYTIVATAIGYKGKKEHIELKPGSNKSLAITLALVTGELLIAPSPEKMSIYVDSQKLVKLTPQKLNLTPGPHTIVLTKKGDVEEYGFYYKTQITISASEKNSPITPDLFQVELPKFSIDPDNTNSNITYFLKNNAEKVEKNLGAITNAKVISAFPGDYTIIKRAQNGEKWSKIKRQFH